MPAPAFAGEIATNNIVELRMRPRAIGFGGWTETVHILGPTGSGATAVENAIPVAQKLAKFRVGVMPSNVDLKQITCHLKGNPADGLPAIGAPQPALNDGAAVPTYKFGTFNSPRDCYTYRLFTQWGQAANLWIHGVPDTQIVAGNVPNTVTPVYSYSSAQPAATTFADGAGTCYDKYIKWLLANTVHVRANPLYNGTTVPEKFLYIPWTICTFDKLSSRKIGREYGAERGRARNFS